MKAARGERSIFDRNDFHVVKSKGFFIITVGDNWKARLPVAGSNPVESEIKE